MAIACLNLVQRRAFLDLFGLEDATIDAPDIVPLDTGVLAAKEGVTTEIARAFAQWTTDAWIARLEAAGVPCGRVQERESVHADPQVEAEELVGEVEQPGLGRVRLLAPFVRVGGERPAPTAAPALGADTEAVLGELA